MDTNTLVNKMIIALASLLDEEDLCIEGCSVSRSTGEEQAFLLFFV
jgi:hypothetical protein